MQRRLHGLDSQPPESRAWSLPDLRLGEIASQFGGSASVRRRSLEALRASERRYRELFEAAGEPTVTAPIAQPQTERDLPTPTGTAGQHGA